MASPVMARGHWNELLQRQQMKLFHTTYKKAREIGPMLYKEQRTENAYEDFETISGFRTFGEVGEASNIPFDDIRPGFKYRIVPRKFARGFTWSRELENDNKYDLIRRATEALAVAAARTREKTAALPFNFAFTNSVFFTVNSEPLVTTSHALIRGGVASNRLATNAAFNVTSLEDMKTLGKKMVDDQNEPIDIGDPEYLLFGTDLWHVVDTVLGSSMRPGEFSNSINPVYRSVKPLSWRYLTDERAWFLLWPKASTHYHLYRMIREAISTDSDVERRNQTKWFLTWFREFIGAPDWRWVVGTPGPV